MRLLLSLGFTFTAATMAASFAADLPTRKAPPPLVAPVVSIGRDLRWRECWRRMELRWRPNIASTRLARSTELLAKSCRRARRAMSTDRVSWASPGGLQLADRQTVFGFETDFQGSGISGSSSVAGPFGFAGGGALALPAGSLHRIADWFGTVRGRVGYLVMDHACCPPPGGLAYGQVTAATDFTAPNVGASYIGRRSVHRSRLDHWRRR